MSAAIAPTPVFVRSRPLVAVGDVRQLAHWRLAIQRLGELDAIAAPSVWAGLEHYMGQSLRNALVDAVRRLDTAAIGLEQRIRTVATVAQASEWRDQLIALRRAYFRTEAMVDFFAEALATRSSPRIGALLRACDHIATRSMAEVLTPLGRQVPAALTFLTKGAGAAILRAGLVLGDGLTANPIAAIRITRHGLMRTALLHEGGHMVSAMLGWNEELASRLGKLPFASPVIADTWASWSSELAADAFALAHSGFASLVALRDVVDGDHAAAFQFLPGDPHPSPTLRLGVSCAVLRRAYGPGPWDELMNEWDSAHPRSAAKPDVRDLITASEPLLPTIADALLWTPYRAFGGKALSELIDPQRVSPRALEELRRISGGALYTSPYWLWNEAIRLLALNGFDASAGAEQTRVAMKRQEEWMLRLGAVRSAA